MKILFITNAFPRPGGHQDAIFLYWRAREIIRQGHKVNVLLWNQNKTEKYNQSFELFDLNNEVFDTNLTVYPCYGLNLFNPFYRKKLYKKIKKNYDLVHFHWLWSMQVFPEIKKWNIPHVVTCHGSDIYRMGESINHFRLGRWINKLVFKYEMKKLNNANYKIFVSEDIKNDAIQKGSSLSSTSVIPNGINNQYFNLKNKKNKSGLLIGFAGLLIERKRADKLIEIFYYLFKHIKEINFVVIGEGHLRQSMENDTKRYQIEDKVHFTGKIDVADVACWMKKMDVFVLPSREEAFGCVIKEAQACGVPVVGSAQGGIPSVIGKGGVCVSEGKDFEKRFAKAVVDLMENPINPKLLSEEVANYTWTKTVSKEIEIYNSIFDS